MLSLCCLVSPLSELSRLLMERREYVNPLGHKITDFTSIYEFNESVHEIKCYTNNVELVPNSSKVVIMFV